MRKLVSLLLAIALLLAACGREPGNGSGSLSAQPDAGGENGPAEEAIPFTLAVFPEFSMHPALAGNRANLTLAPLLYEGLFRLDEHFRPVPVLCQRYTVTPDKLTWTFTLRTGITFSDGTPLTGEIVAQSLELARSEQGNYRQRLGQVVDIVGEGASVTVTLASPNGDLPALLDIPIALGEGERPAGTGPYVLSGGDEELALTVRRDWWQKKELPLASIPLYGVKKSDELTYAFDTGSISLLEVDLMATNAMGYAGNYQTWDYTTTALVYLGFNTASGPCRDGTVRRVLAQAVDREGIAQTIYANHAVATSLPVHPDSPLYNETAAAVLSYCPEGLADRLEELRLGNRSLRFVVNSENEAKLSAAQRIAYQLEAAGVKVELSRLTFEEYAAALDKGEFDLYLAETILTADFDLSPLLHASGALNYGGWRDEETDGLIAALRAAGEEERPQAAAELFDRLVQQLPIVPILFKNSSALTQWGRVSGLTPLRGNVFHGLENWIIS